MNPDGGVELALVLASLALYVGYHMWLFLLRDWVNMVVARVLRRTSTQHRAVVPTASSDARMAWTYVVSMDKTDSAVPAVQTLRNSIMAASFMATTCGLMASSGLLPILTDSQRLGQIRKLGDLDPVVELAGSRGLLDGRVEWKVAICELILLLSLLFFVQSIRLYSFSAYFIRLQTADESIRSRFTLDLTLAVARRAGHCWTLGTRTFYLVIPAILWFMGPLTCFIVTCVVILFLAASDSLSISHGDVCAVTGSKEEELTDEVAAGESVSENGGQPKGVKIEGSAGSAGTECNI